VSEHPVPVWRIAGAVPGDSLDPHNNSGITAALFEAFARRGLLVRRLDVAISRGQRRRLAARTFHPSRREWQARFRRAVYECQSRNCARLLEGDDQPNVVLQVFRGFQARGRPYWLFLDTTDALRRAAGRPAPFGPEGLGQHTERALYQGAQHIFVMASQPQRSLVRDYGVVDERVSVVGAGPNMEYPESLRALGRVERYQSRTVLFVGRHDFERKGGPELLDAFAQARSAVGDARLLVAGVELTRDPPGVQSVGEVLDRKELARLYEEATIFCLPSRFEPFGVVALEAMAFGLPVVGTRVGGLAEAVRHDETGILVPPGATEELAGALVRLLRDPQAASRMGANGRRTIDEQLNWDLAVERMLRAVAY